MLLDLTDKNMTGKEAEEKLEKTHIILNKNTIPFETKSPFITSGIRIGTPAVTTRSMKEKETTNSSSESIARTKIEHFLDQRGGWEGLGGGALKGLISSIPIVGKLIEDSVYGSQNSEQAAQFKTILDKCKKKT